MTNSTPDPKHNKTTDQQSQQQEEETVEREQQMQEVVQNVYNEVDDSSEGLPHSSIIWDHYISIIWHCCYSPELTQLDTKLDELDKYLDQLEERNESLRQQISDFLNDMKDGK